MRGGEKVLTEFGRMFPQSPIYTLVARKEKLSENLQRHAIRPSILNHLPQADRHYKKMLPLFPTALKNLAVQGGPKLLLSSDASVIKGLQYDRETRHICYNHSPPRYLWDMEDTYLQHSAGIGSAGRAFFKTIAPGLREFDYAAAERVDHFIANSEFVKQRILKHYGRSAQVIHPPVDIEHFSWEHPAEDFYLIVSELVPYKRIDIAIDAFNKLGKKLVIIGGGSEMAALQAQARPNVAFLGRQPFFVLKHHYEHCKAFIFPGVEDFGITPLEAQAAGRPVIALRDGGALETVVDGVTGRFFDEQTPEALAEAVSSFEKEADRFSPRAARQNATKYSAARFRREMMNYLSATCPDLFPAAMPVEQDLILRN
jgi:glycosyltransferase involved in cell wall biosynthesis